MFLIFLGPPGAGKGTQAKAISKKLGLPHISTGELFRKEMKKETDLGKRITEVMNSGGLVDDKTVMEVFEKRLKKPDCQNGAVLDGIPRTKNQANLLDKLLNKIGKTLDHVIYIDLDKNEIIKRISGRRTCKKCGAVYHRNFKPSQTAGKCDLDGGELFQREDQKEKAVKKRIKVYQKQTAPLIKHYKKKNLLINIDGSQSIEKVTSEILEKLNL